MEFQYYTSTSILESLQDPKFQVTAAIYFIETIVFQKVFFTKRGGSFFLSTVKQYIVPQYVEWQYLGFLSFVVHVEALQNRVRKEEEEEEEEEAEQENSRKRKNRDLKE